MRDPLDRYYTPQLLADLLTTQVKNHLWSVQDPWPFPPTILEPSCGDGAWVRAIRRTWAQATIHGVDLDPGAVGLDLVDVPCGLDFLKFNPPDRPFDLILGNPPYNHALSHVEHALTMGWCVGFLLRLAFLESSQRLAFWTTNPATRIWVLAERPNFTGKGTDSSAYGFFLWDRDHQGPTRLDVISWKNKSIPRQGCLFNV